MQRDAVVRLIEDIFRAERKIIDAVQERRSGYVTSTFTGGAGSGHCRIADPTAIRAIRNVIELDCVMLDDGQRILYPERWLRVIRAVREFCARDTIDREIFRRKYTELEPTRVTCDKISIDQSVYSRRLLKIRNYAKVCAAQEQLIRFF